MLFKKISLHTKLIFGTIFTYLFFLSRGRARKLRTSSVKKILIMQPAKLGDMVCTTQMFRAVKKVYPEAMLLVLGTKINQALIAHHPDVDEYIVTAKNFFELLHRLRKERIDFGCILTPNAVGIILFYLARIPLIAVPKVVNGWSPYETFYYRLLRPLCLSVPHAMGSYAPREYLRLLEPIGINTDDTTKTLAFSPEAKEKMKQLLLSKTTGQQSSFLVGISPSAGNKIKCWDAKKFAAVASEVGKKYHATIVIVGSKVDETEVANMVSHMDSSVSLINTCATLNLDELKALMSLLHVFISVDSGPIYIAEAFGIPTINIVGPVDENEQPPRGPLHRNVLWDGRGKPEMHVMNARVYDAVKAREMIDRITPSMVMQEVDILMGLLKKTL